MSKRKAISATRLKKIAKLKEKWKKAGTLDEKGKIRPKLSITEAKVMADYTIETLKEAKLPLQKPVDISLPEAYEHYLKKFTRQKRRKVNNDYRIKMLFISRTGGFKEVIENIRQKSNKEEAVSAVIEKYRYTPEYIAPNGRIEYRTMWIKKELSKGFINRNKKDI